MYSVSGRLLGLLRLEMTMIGHVRIKAVNVFLLILSANLSGVWYVYTLNDLEPLVNILLILTAILALFIDPWLENKSNRKASLTAVAMEAHINYR